MRGYKLHELFICLDEQKKPVNIRGENVLALIAAIRLYGAVLRYPQAKSDFIHKKVLTNLSVCFIFPFFQEME